MSENPKVSIIIPTYNRPIALMRAIDSAATQSYKNIEIVVVDDGAFSSATKETAERFAASHPSCTVHYVFQENAGSAAARNTGVKMSSGEYIVFLDDDDILFPNYVSEMLGAFRRNGEKYEAGISDWIVEDANRRLSYGVSAPSPLKCPGNGWMFKRDVFFEKGLWYDPQFRNNEDFELGLRSWDKYEAIFLHTPLFKYSGPLPAFPAKGEENKGGNLTNSSNNYADFMKELSKNASVVASMSVADRAIIEHHAGLFAARSGLMSKAREHLLCSLKSTFSFTKLFYFLATFLGWRGFMAVRVAASRIRRRVEVWRTRELVRKYRSIIPL